MEKRELNLREGENVPGLFHIHDSPVTIGYRQKLTVAGKEFREALAYKGGGGEFITSLKEDAKIFVD